MTCVLEAREKLAKLSGIVLAHSGLTLAVEGHTDNVGSDEVNQKLSEHRAESVRNYLIEQGLAQPNVTAQGLASPLRWSITRRLQTGRRIAEWKLWSRVK